MRFEDRTGKSPKFGLDPAKILARRKRKPRVKGPEKDWSRPKARFPRVLVIGSAIVGLGLILVSLVAVNHYVERESGGAIPVPVREEQGNESTNFFETANVTEVREATREVVRGFMEATTDAERWTLLADNFGIANAYIGKGLYDEAEAILDRAAAIDSSSR